MVAHEHIGGPPVEPLPAFNLESNAEKTAADAHHPNPVGQERSGESKDGGEKKHDEGRERQERQDEAGEEIPHGRPDYSSFSARTFP